MTDVQQAVQVHFGVGLVLRYVKDEVSVYSSRVVSAEQDCGVFQESLAVGAQE